MVTSFPATLHDVDLVLNQDNTTMSLSLNNLDRYMGILQGVMGADLEQAETDFQAETGVSLIALMNSLGSEAGLALDDFALNMEGVMATMMGGASETAPAEVHTMMVMQLKDAGPSRSCWTPPSRSRPRIRR